MVEGRRKGSLKQKRRQKESVEKKRSRRREFIVFKENGKFGKFTTKCTT